MRELLSNCSDALEKQRFIDLKGEKENDIPLQINIITNKEKKQLIIQDTGIGMSEQELVENLGTIANSGSKKFLENLDEEDEALDTVIGQFGVGFYSGFIVGQTIQVYSKKTGEDAHVWTSDGMGTFSVEKTTDFNLERGTKIVIHLKPEFENFALKEQIQTIIDKYSNFINHPIYLNHEKVNIVEALWSKSPS